MNEEMNKRIEELAEQAGFQYIKDEGIGWAGNYNASLPKFAKLLIEECISTVQKRYMGDYNREDMEVLRCVADMKKHFGVK